MLCILQQEDSWYAFPSHIAYSENSVIDAIQDSFAAEITTYHQFCWRKDISFVSSSSKIWFQTSSTKYMMCKTAVKRSEPRANMAGCYVTKQVKKSWYKIKLQNEGFFLGFLSRFL